NDVAADAFDVAVAPLLEREGRSRSAALFRRPFVAAARRMRFLLVRRAVRNIDAATIRLPARNSARELLVRIRDAPVVLFLEFVFDRVRSGVTAQPELFDELLALFIRLQALERRPLFVRDDVGDVL